MRLAMLAALALWSSLACAALPGLIPACDIGSEWPSYTYLKRSGDKPGTEVVGLSVEYLRRMLARQKIVVAVDLIPWKRCLAAVESGEYAMLLNASRNAERDKAYLVSRPYYQVTDVYFYARSRPVRNVDSPAALRKLKMCGQAGYNYVNFGVENTEVDMGAATLPQAMDKLRAGFCDVVLARLEIAAGHQLTAGVDFTKDASLACAAPAYIKPSSFHMMISRRVPYGPELLATLNQGIEEQALNGASKPENLLRNCAG